MRNTNQKNRKKEKQGGYSEAGIKVGRKTENHRRSKYRFKGNRA